MPGRRSLAIAVAVVMAALVTPSGAGAATEVGDDCAAGVEEAHTYVNVPDHKAADASPLPISAPVGGVVTSWKLRSLSGETVPVRMAVFRETPITGRFLIAAASGIETEAFGLNTFKARITVQKGDRFGLIPIDEKTVSCVTGEMEDASWSYSEPVEVGSEYQFGAGVFVRVPVVAVIEPDVDGDGYGDETQDGCPQSAATIAPCPAVTTKFAMKPKGNAVIARVSVSSQASVQVFGQVSWQVRGKPKTSARNHGLTVGISAGGPRQVSAGQPMTFRAPFSKPILRRLGRITPHQALMALMTVRTTDVAGKVTEQRRRVKLKGRAGA
jgi:hypothetical protein